jgi:hypothetical protein
MRIEGAWRFGSRWSIERHDGAPDLDAGTNETDRAAQRTTGPAGEAGDPGRIGSNRGRIVRTSAEQRLVLRRRDPAGR